MTISLAACDTDDPAYLARITALLAGITAERDFRKLHLLQLDNWFDHKWLGFSGEVMGSVGVWQSGDRLTIPAFHPNRVVSQRDFTREDAKSELEESTPAKQLHIKQPSVRNLQRHVEIVAGRAAILWYTGRTLSNGKGAAMAYLPREEGYETWYASLVRKESWVVDKTKQISKAAFEELGSARPISG